MSRAANETGAAFDAVAKRLNEKMDKREKELELESKALNASYHASCGGRFAKVWSQLHTETVDQLQALIDEEADCAYWRHVDSKIDEVRGK